MSVVIVPVGFDMGPVYAEDGPADRTPIRYEVHLGGGPTDLTAIEYTAWRAAFADSAAHAKLEVDRARLERYLREEGHEPAGRIADPAPVVTALLEQDLLLEFDSDGDDLEEVFGVRRLYPRAEGMDSREDEPSYHDIGFDDQALCAVQPNAYTAWSFGLTEATLWGACEMVAEIADSDLQPGQDPVTLTTLDVAKDVANSLPLLLSTKAAFLDLLNYELSRIIEPMPFPPRDRLVSPTGKPPVIVPVGLRLGYEFFEVDPAGWDDERLRVHFGDRLLELPDDEAVVWSAAFDDPLRHAEHGVTRASLEDDLRDHPLVGDPADVVDRLLDRGLLAEFEPVDGPLEELFRSVQLYPLGEGLGNSPDDPTMYRIGNRGETWLAVPPEVYLIWSYSLTGRSLWSACADLAEGYDEDLRPGEVPAGFSADEFARDVAAVLPALIATRCAFIDPLNYFL